MKQKKVKLVSMLLCTLMVMGTLSGCGDKKTNSAADSDKNGNNLPPLEYSCYIGSTNPIKVIDNSNDVVTPYIEKKFNIKVKEVIQPQSTVLPKEKLNMMIAANTVPDVMIADGEFAAYAISTGKFVDDLEPYIKDMKNYNKYFDEDMWGNFKTNGKISSIPFISASKKTDDMYKDDPFYNTFSGWSFWVREDILAKAGYTFTPIAELKKNITDQGKKLTLEDMKITPAIDTPEKWVEMLKKIKDLNLKAGEKPVIPLSIASWNQWHIGNMVGLSQWKIGDDGKVSGYIGCPEAKDWYKTLWSLYRDGILDKEFLIQKDDALQEKIASGRVAAGMFIPNRAGAIENLQKSNPDAAIRYIPWPKSDPNKGSFDVMQGGFWRIIINKDVKDVKRLTQYFDWFYSDEGLDVLTWGPESAGLWEMKDGKKVFKDQQLADALINGGPKEGTKGPEYYGLFTPYAGGGLMNFNCKAAICAPVFQNINPVDSRRSYPVKFDIYDTSQTICGSNGVNRDGKAAYGDGGANTSAVATYYWGKFQNDRVGKVFAAKSEEEFDKAWEQQYNIFLKETKYDDAVKDMEKFFNETLKK